MLPSLQFTTEKDVLKKGLVCSVSKFYDQKQHAHI